MKSPQIHTVALAFFKMNGYFVFLSNDVPMCYVLCILQLYTGNTDIFGLL